MGGKSSKKKKEEDVENEEGEQSKKGKRGKNSKKNKKSKKGTSGSQSDLSSTESRKDSVDKAGDNANKEFVKFVQQALKFKSELSTLADIEAHISKAHRSILSAFNRRKIIRKVVTEEISKGRVAIRLVRGGCP